MSAYQRSVETLTRLADDNPAVTEFRSRLADSHNSIGHLQSETGKPGEALESYRRALAIGQKLADDNPDVTEFRYSLADTHHNIGMLQWQTGKPGRGAGVVPAGAGDPAEAGRRQPRRHRLPKQPGDQPQQHRHFADGYRQAGRGAGVVPAGAGDQAEAGRRQPRRHRIPQQPGGQLTTTSATCSRRPASRSRRWSRTGGRWRSSRSWPTTTPPSPPSETTWRTPSTTSAIYSRRPAGLARRWSRTGGRWRSGQRLTDENPDVPNYRGIAGELP